MENRRHRGYRAKPDQPFDPSRPTRGQGPRELSSHSSPAPGTEKLSSEARITEAELAWDRSPRNPDRQAQTARNIEEYEAFRAGRGVKYRFYSRDEMDAKRQGEEVDRLTV